ncbi:hypothetical protein CDL12_02516 [Handroanthus impetiginosus]|uniref:SAYSvFN domain-containing protein n=1 Tax=Handroanthus impetiginosus TaxID=429701 RepID=A0A2G9I559_9LAMI|nr:hypothetical protein CDL12_02516 [Handroanthus impetiginosus]
MLIIKLRNGEGSISCQSAATCCVFLVPCPLLALVTLVLPLCSAYSIFNEDFRELPGTLNAEHLDRDIRLGRL